jgi:lysyl-tRNA synthetase class II
MDRLARQVVGVGTLTADAKQLEEVKELAVDVTADLREVSNQQVKDLCLKAREILVEEANIQWIDSPVTVSLLTRQLDQQSSVVGRVREWGRTNSSAARSDCERWGG